MNKALRAFSLAVVLCGPALAGDASPVPDLKRAYPKGAEGQWRLGLSVDDLLERDLWSDNTWKECRVQKLDWTFRVSWKVQQATSKGLLFEATILEFAGSWTDRSPDDPARPEVQVTLPAAEGKADAWTEGLAAMQGAHFRFEVDPKGGVSRVAGLSAAAAKAFQKLSCGKDTKALAQDLSAWFSDEAWASMLDGLLPVFQTDRAAWKSERRYPFPCSRGFGAQPIPPAPMEMSLQGEEGQCRLQGLCEAGKVDEMLQFIGQPGFHSLGTERKGEGLTVFAPSGMKEARLAYTVHDRWDNYRPSAKADRFDRHATVALKAEALQ